MLFILVMLLLTPIILISRFIFNHFQYNNSKTHRKNKIGEEKKGGGGWGNTWSYQFLAMSLRVCLV